MYESILDRSLTWIFRSPSITMLLYFAILGARGSVISSINVALVVLLFSGGRYIPMMWNGLFQSQVSVSRPISFLGLMNSFTIISSLFLTNLAFSVASLITDAVSVIILLVTAMCAQLSWLWLFVM